MRRHLASRPLVRWMASSIVASIAATAPAYAFAQTAMPQPYPPPPYAPPLPQPGQAPAGYVPLVLQGVVPGMSYQLTPDFKNAAPIAGCATDCMVYVAPGKYRLTVGETTDTRSGRRVIEVFGPTHALVEPRTKAAKDTGLLMGISGSVLVLAGAVGLAIALTNESHCGSYGQGCETKWSDGATISLLALLGGCVLTPIGWVQFGRSAPSVTTAPLRPVAASAPLRVSFDLVPLRRTDATGSTTLAGGLAVGMVAF